jgi:purine-binding chemotaxis protein CheW
MGGTEQKINFGDVVGGANPPTPEQEREETISFLIMSIAGETFALNIDQVREVIRVPKISWVPGAQNSVRGVINLRGSIIAVLELADLLHLQGRSDEIDEDNRIIIVESGTVTVGLMVDSVSEVAAISPEEIEQTMRTLDEEQRSAVISQTTIRERIVGILDIDHIISVAKKGDQEY